MGRNAIHTDKALVNRMLRGNKEAFDEFFREYFARLYRFTVTRLSDHEDAIEEIVQKTICRAVRKLATYRGEASLFTWLCCLCRNEISDYLKRTAKETQRTARFDDIEVRAVLETLDSGPDADPLNHYRQTQLAELVQTVLDHLPARQGNVLEWKYVQGFTVNEIAERLGISQQAVQSLLARGRQSFRDGFEATMNAGPDLVLGELDAGPPGTR